jgi:hypothetical protein
MRWYLVGLVMLAACGFNSDDAKSVSRLLHRELGCPTPERFTACPDGGELDRVDGPLTISACADGDLVLDGEGIEVNVTCTQSVGMLDLVGAFTTADGDDCDLDLHVRSTISQTCGGLFGTVPCETDWSTSGTVCGFRVDELCTGGGGFLSFIDCH